LVVNTDLQMTGDGCERGYRLKEQEMKLLISISKMNMSRDISHSKDVTSFAFLNTNEETLQFLSAFLLILLLNILI
jgi:hypothetical protein